jgi:DNA-binding transcriptional ArsR family regulator
MEQKGADYDSNLVSLLFEQHRYQILKAVAERPDAVQLLTLRLGMPKRAVRRHLDILLRFGLVSPLPKSQSPFDPNKKSKYVSYKISDLGLKILAEHEKKPEVDEGA